MMEGLTHTYTVTAYTATSGSSVYSYTDENGTVTTSWSSPTSPITVPGLTNGVDYYFRVAGGQHGVGCDSEWFGGV